VEELEEVILHEGRAYVLATSSLADDRVQILKAGNEFMVVDRRGDIQDLDHSPQGLYFGDTRFLSEFVIRLGAARPLLLSSRITKSNTALIVDMTNSSLPTGEGYATKQDTIHLERTKVLLAGCSYEQIKITNFGDGAALVGLVLDFAADFADIFEVRGQTREKRGQLLEPLCHDDCVVLAYIGLDDLRRETRLRFSPRPKSLTAGRAVFQLDIARKETETLEIVIHCCQERAETQILTTSEALRSMAQQAEEAREQECRIETSNEQFNKWLERSSADLWMLTTPTEHGLFPYAGTPWFSTPFGRDSIITALQTLLFNPSLARGVLSYLAAYQAEEEDAERDAEPGKILHESRTGEMARLGEVPFRQYYGSVDSTPLFVMLAGAYFKATADKEFLHDIWPNVERALRWMETYGDPDNDGFIEYQRRTPRGIRNQAWKDSHDSVFHADGTLAEGAVAAAEVQSYAFSAWRQGALLARRFGNKDAAQEWEARAQRIADQFHQAFWCDSLGTYAIALDGGKRPCCVRSSNAGQCLFTGLVTEARAKRVAKALLEPDMFSGWGIRTIGEREKRYNPMSYHNGAVWPHDNSLIAAGLARYGLKSDAMALMTGLFRASEYFDLRRLPELFCGFPANEGNGPTIYPVACVPQAWAAGSPFLLLRACLGIQIDASKAQIHLHRPLLPEYLQEVVLKRLRVGPHQLDLRFQRYPNTVGVDVTRREGPVTVHMIT
jgi:glycogen debranching enzyme